MKKFDESIINRQSYYLPLSHILSPWKVLERAMVVVVDNCAMEKR